MRRSIATVSLSGTLDEKLRAIAAAHFGGVEIFENDLVNFSGKPRDVRQLRRGGYDGHGEVNAPTYLAAQAMTSSAVVA